MSIAWVSRRLPDLDAWLSAFGRALPRHLPEASSAALFGGITLGAFSPPWSDIDLIVFTETPEVTEETERRAWALWEELAGRPHGKLAYLYVAPLAAAGGPMNPAGGGLPGGPRSIRVYRLKRRAMAGYPLSLPDTVALARYGQTLYGQEMLTLLPPIPTDWAAEYLSIRLGQHLAGAQRGAPPFGPDPEQAAAALGPGGLMAEVQWMARHLYSLTSGELLAKEHAAYWYMGRGREGALAQVTALVQGWRERGEAPPVQVLAVSRLMEPALREFLAEALALCGVPDAALPTGSVGALERALHLLGRPQS